MNAPAKSATREKEDQAYELRLAGVTFDEVARRTGYANAGSARRAYLRAKARRDVPHDVVGDDPRALDVARLERLTAAVWAKAIRGDKEAQELVIRTMELRVKIERRPGENTGELLAAFNKTVEASSALGDVDAGVVAAGRALAARIDAAVALGEGQEVTKALYLMPHLMNVYRELLATPAARAAATPGGAAAEKGGRLLQMREGAAARRGGAA